MKISSILAFLGAASLAYGQTTANSTIVMTTTAMTTVPLSTGSSKNSTVVVTTNGTTITSTICPKCSGSAKPSAPKTTSAFVGAAANNVGNAALALVGVAAAAFL